MHEIIEDTNKQKLHSRKERNLARFRTNRSKIINENSDIFSSCKCNSRVHKFSYTVTPALKKNLTQKKSNSTRHSKQKRKKRFSFKLTSPRTCTPVSPVSPDMSIISPDISLMSPPTGRPPTFYDTNISLSGFPCRSPTA